jgi:hypothetical protein
LAYAVTSWHSRLIAAVRAAVHRRAGTGLAESALMVSFINLGPYSFVRVELLPLTPNGPYRLTVEHPAKTLVEYFETPIAAMSRQAEIERVLTNHADAGNC